MNAKRATVRLFVATTGLLASLLELTGTLVRLGTAGLRFVTALLDSLTRRLRGPVDASTHMTLAPAVMAPLPTPVAAPVARVAASPTVSMTGDERLTSALLSLKFPTAKVRLFAASVAGRQEPLKVLVKEGIVALSSPSPVLS
jgi:hypothetical protein